MNKKSFLCLVLVLILVLGGSFVAYTSMKENQTEKVTYEEIPEQEDATTEEVEQVETEEVETNNVTSNATSKQNEIYANQKIERKDVSEQNNGLNEHIFSDVETSDEEEVAEFKPEAQKEYEAKVEEKVEEAKEDDKKVATENEDGSIFIGGTKPEESESSKSTDTEVSEPAPEVEEKTTETVQGEKATDSMKDFLLKNSTQNLQN